MLDGAVDELAQVLTLEDARDDGLGNDAASRARQVHEGRGQGAEAVPRRHHRRGRHLGGVLGLVRGRLHGRTLEPVDEGNVPEVVARGLGRRLITLEHLVAVLRIHCVGEEHVVEDVDMVPGRLSRVDRRHVPRGDGAGTLSCGLLEVQPGLVDKLGSLHFFVHVPRRKVMDTLVLLIPVSQGTTVIHAPKEVGTELLLCAVQVWFPAGLPARGTLLVLLRASSVAPAPMQQLLLHPWVLPVRGARRQHGPRRVWDAPRGADDRHVCLVLSHGQSNKLHRRIMHPRPLRRTL
mmetsp:Transcript_24697/g.72435  ORF Transcript_24697/g.72435 Transcript_24697/m.72435 type:complete len:292 (-) Transcript_24697:1614-2489(-)